MSSTRAFVAGCCVAAAVAVAGWVLRVRPDLAEAERRVQEAEESARDARRSASDAELWADAERSRTQELRDRIRELERGGQTTPPPPGGTHGPSAMGRKDTGPAPPPDAEPELWDRQRINREMERLTRISGAAAMDPQFPKLVRALRARPDEAYELLKQVLSGEFPKEFIQVSAMLAEALNERRLKPELLARSRKEADLPVRASLLRALTVIPGDEAVDDFLKLVEDGSADERLRMVAVRGLAFRGHEVARRVAAGELPGTPPGLRMRALESLRDFAEREGWIDTALVPVFGKALLTADGDPQRRVAYLGIEGFWSKDSVPDLEKFVASADAPKDVAARAQKMIDGLAAGAPKPPGAGLPERQQPPR